jgi:hypothetical protein
MRLAHKLSMEFRAAEDRINQLAAEAKLFRERVGRWYEPRLVLALPKTENEMADALVNLFEWCNFVCFFLVSPRWVPAPQGTTLIKLHQIAPVNNLRAQSIHFATPFC